MFKLKGMNFGEGTGKKKPGAPDMKTGSYKQSFEKPGPPQTEEPPGHGSKITPSVLYTSNGKAVKTANIDEGELDLTVKTDSKGKYALSSDGIKYYYENPKKTDMSKLRSKQARSRKGISEWQHFKQPSQGDEPIVEESMKSKK